MRREREPVADWNFNKLNALARDWETWQRFNVEIPNMGMRWFSLIVSCVHSSGSKDRILQTCNKPIKGLNFRQPPPFNMWYEVSVVSAFSVLFFFVCVLFLFFSNNIQFSFWFPPLLRKRSDAKAHIHFHSPGCRWRRWCQQAQKQLTLEENGEDSLPFSLLSQMRLR